MHSIQNAFHAADLPRDAIATIGNYDGIHRGQRVILDQVVARARERDLPAVVVTFNPHPLTVLRPEAVPPALTSIAQKERLLEAAGIDVVLWVRFDEELAATSAESFVRGYLHGRLGLQELYVGSSFVFGRGREGSLGMLQRLGQELGFAAQGVPELAHNGQRISSSRIRQALAMGQAEEAAVMLGRPFGLEGVVVRGDRMGKRLGWPTINVSQTQQLVPLDGVYAGRVVFPSFPASFVAVTNIGTRPTVYENYQRVVESHILDFSSDVYGQRVEVQFLRRLREERIFPSVMDLSAQIRRDVEATREFFSSRRHLEEVTGPT